MDVDGVERTFPPVIVGGTVPLLFSAFDGSGVNFANVGIIGFLFNGSPPVGTYQIDSLTAAIPESEHGMLVMAFAAGICVLYIRLRK